MSAILAALGVYGLKILATLLLLVVLSLVYKASWEWMYLPPGPWGLPLIGYIPFFPNAYEMGRHFWNLQKKYKGDCLTINLGEHQVIVLNSWAAIDTAFRHPYMAGKPDNRLRRLMVECGQDSMFLNQGPGWAFTRRIGIRAISLFTSSRTSKMEQATTLVSRWIVEQFDALNGKPTETKSMCYQASAAVTGAMTFGFEPAPSHQFLEQLAKLGKAFVEVAEGQSAITMFYPTLEIFDKRQKNAERDALNNVLNHVKQWIREYKHRSDGEIHNLMDAIHFTINEIPPEEKEKRELSDEKIKAMTFDLFEAPAASVSEAMEWTLLCLAYFPEVQKRAQQEIDDICGDEQPNLSHMCRLIYTRSVLHENWRYNSAWIFEGMQRSSTEDIWFRGYWFKKGTAYWANVTSIHFDPEIFPDPDKFTPERFIKPDGTFNQELVSKIQSFGMGTRRCIGETFTIQLMVTMCASILQRFNIYRDPYNRGDPLREINELGFDFVPKHHKLIFKPRNKDGPII